MELREVNHMHTVAQIACDHHPGGSLHSDSVFLLS